MSRNLVLLTFVASSFIAPAALAQRWLSQLPQKSEQELTFEDYKRAFESYYKEHPVDLAKREKLAPTFRFEGTEEIQNRTEVEEYKLFKRWEWFTERGPIPPVDGISSKLTLRFRPCRRKTMTSLSAKPNSIHLACRSLKKRFFGLMRNIGGHSARRMPLAGQTWGALNPSNFIPRKTKSFILGCLVAAAGKTSMSA